MKAPRRLLLIVLCSVGFSAVYILLCCWACLPFCSAFCLDPHLSIKSRPTVPGPLHFSGYSSVPDGKPLVREPCRSCAVVSSSGQMLGSGLGAEIDSAECVLRMNQAPTMGFEADVGQRSTLRVISHTSVPLLLRNYSHYFQQARDTLYVVWGQGKHMDRALGGRTYRALLQLTRMYPGLQVYTFTERMMAYCDQVFQDETGKNRRQSGSFLSTGWFTMILALELCEEIVVYGMVSDSYCSQEGKSPSPFYRWVIEAQGVCLGLESPSSLARGRSITPRCLTTTSRRAGWTSVKCTWRMSGRPAAPTASSPRRPCSLAGPRRGPSSLPTHPGGRSGPIATAPSPGLCCSHTPPKTLNLWILPSAMCRVDLSSLPAIPLGTLGSHLGLLDLGREEEASGDLCSLLPTPAP
ncbi:alpha-N-acetyl-neuraminyl-2,3-beta-galactosyl-1,3-N-acetyl-galactosaminide alpha-2,6-sialyltransferase isoform X2 [Ovis aries]|uniref:alpha-N-acetyl-neuraminyl-2,3-beta-galactosyl-1, 3-N-acetyl-galactosaminide alpha-2,6-sialyltransferase isoform X2 n=1 Tax=Ovis aries TaxID=9940 RepID=UPI001C2E3711|nr:alpha-N-acetyl-neuraminyl-2,3-beta-galactosyl-1,3-N-acetyl-galactosaminide alpha-2,6-sialyltransferase isoform X2 [Ovis aries]